jgi:double-strand break repair protein MRE11
MKMDEEERSVGPEQTALEDPDGNTMRIMLSTDNHLGYNERDPVRGMDSFAAFEEVLYLAKRFRCDFVLIAGDLFHENKPSRNTMFKAMEIIRRYTMGENPVRIQILSDQAKNFPTGVANYQDPNYSVDLPIFSIHGNHDDPVRDTGNGQALAALGMFFADSPVGCWIDDLVTILTLFLLFGCVTHRYIVGIQLGQLHWQTRQD